MIKSFSNKKEKDIKKSNSKEGNNQTDSKEKRLLTTAFNLFTEKGIKNTSIQEIVDNADVGKGTFYLYFKDKYEIRDILIVKKTKKLFQDALKELRKENYETLTEQVLFVIDYVINELEKNTILLKFISTNLSWGIYNKTVNKLYEQNESEDEENSILKLFLKNVKEKNIKIDNPEVTLYMIIQLTSSTCFNSILYKDPLPINEFKPILFNTIKTLINE